MDFSPPTEPQQQQGPDLHEDSSPWATTRQRNTKDPYDLILSNSKIRAFWRRETTGRHEFTARRLAELSLGARRAGRGFEPSSSALRAPGPRRTPCVKYDSCAIIYLSSRNVCVTLHTELQLHAARRDLLRRGCSGPEVVHLDRRPVISLDGEKMPCFCGETYTLDA